VKERRWTLWVRDERGKRHRGIVSYGEDAPQQPPEPPAQFRIALLARPVSTRRAPDATAICIPKLAKTRAVVDSASTPTGERAIVAALKSGELPAQEHAQYRAGRIVVAAGEVEARNVFAGAGHLVDLEHLGRVLVSRANAEALAPFIATIRRELRLPPGADALVALESRLHPPDPTERPPARAPGIVRLRGVFSRLKAGAVPEHDIETLIEDLRFLRLFEREAHPLRGEALDRLLADVAAASPPARKSTKREPATILRMRPRREVRRGSDA
jgi:hypothetical protein